MLGELPAGISTATPVQMRGLVDRGVLPLETLSTLAALWPTAGVPTGAEVTEMLDATAEILAAGGDRADMRAAVA